jgi:hypothetical protein
VGAAFVQVLLVDQKFNILSDRHKCNQRLARALGQAQAGFSKAAIFLIALSASYDKIIACVLGKRKNVGGLIWKNPSD